MIANLEVTGEVDRFIFGFEESSAGLAGPYVRDGDAVIGSMRLICEMAAYYCSIGSSTGPKGPKRSINSRPLLRTRWTALEFLARP